jgi:hypothetical protein
MAMSYDNIEAKVVKAKWPIVQSLGELRYWKSRADSKLPANMETFDIWSLDGQQFQVLVLTAPTIGPPDESHILAYLRNSDGDIIDWASELQSGYSCSSLYAELMDVNNNSLEELCFVRHPSLPM